MSKTQRYCIIYNGEDTCPDNWKGDYNRMIWEAERFVATDLDINDEYRFKEMVLNFIAKWRPYDFGIIMSHYLDIYPSYTNELRAVMS